MSTIYKRIAELCADKGVSGAKMCSDIGVSKSLMTSLKTGRTSTINSKTAQKIASYFGVPVGQVLGDAPNPIEIEKNIADKEYQLRELKALIFEEGDAKKPADQKADGLRDAGYYELTPENQKMIDALIDSLLKSQSGE